MIRRTLAACAVAAAVGSALEAQARPIDEVPVVESSAETTQSVFSKEEADAIKAGSSGATGVGGSSAQQDVEHGSNVTFANSNTKSSDTVFSQKFARPQGGGAGSSQAAPAISAQAPDPVPAGQSQDGLEPLRKQLADTQKQLQSARKQVKQLEDTYGSMPASSDGSVDNEARADAVPSVPSSVMMTGGSGGSESTNILVTPGVNQIITISTDQPNRIVTPFNHPQILSSALEAGSGDSCGEVCVKGSVIYISTKKDYPLGMFVTEKGNEPTAVSLTLVPRRIPPREVHLQLSDSASALMQGSDEAKAWETEQPFVSGVKKAMKAIALGEVPNGYHIQKIPSGYPLPSCTQEGLNFDFGKGQLLAGANLNYVIGKITNVGQREIEFHEASCGGYDVAAVAAYPYNLLRPGESTEVYVVQRINSQGSVQQSRRRSLLSSK